MSNRNALLDEVFTDAQQNIADIRAGVMDASKGDVIAREHWSMVKSVECGLNADIARGEGKIHAVEK